MEDSDIKESLTNEKDLMMCRILSYNVFMRPPGISSDKVGDVKNERLQGIITNILPKYDIICLQEMFTRLNCRRETLIAAAKDAGLKYFSIPPEQPFFSLYMINSGLLTMSRHKIVATDFIPFANGSGVDRLAYKGVMYSRIEMAPGKYLNLFNVHLQAHYHSLDKDNITSRLNQILELRKTIELCLRTYTKLFEKIDGHETFEEPIYVIGDFNVCANKHMFSYEGYLRRNTTNDNFFDFIDQSHPEDPNFSEYEYLMYMLRKNFDHTDEPNKVVDFLFDKYGYHPITYIEDIHSEIEVDIHQMTNHDSMDFIFQIIPPGQDENRIILKSSPTSSQVQPFRSDANSNYKYTSDHLGIEFVVKIPELMTD